MSTSRRKFLQTAAAATTAAAVAGPIILNAQDKAGTKTPVIGTGAFTYECHHNWGEVPSHIKWFDTHGVAVDEAGMIYVKHRGVAKDEPMDTIVVFDPAGKFVRSFGKEYHGGGHGIDIRKEGGEEFLYLCDVYNDPVGEVRHGLVAKTNLKGEPVWVIKQPAEPDVYGDFTDAKKRFVPTNVAFAPNGGFYIGDGYGSHYIHQYDKHAKWVRTWGGAGKEEGKMQTPHGLWLDNRPGREPSLVVADRANARLQYFTLDGKFLSIVSDVLFPAHFDIRGDVLMVPDLHTRISLFDKDNKPIVHLGFDEEWKKQALEGFKMRQTPDQWQPGRFIHPHDACFDKAGNIFVVEWVPAGRVTKLRLVG